MVRSTLYYHIKPQNKSSKENFHIELIKHICLKAGISKDLINRDFHADQP
ncbi:hypothetical protein [Bacteroides sp.]|nr:hypothetical protein [Bacteroides sp.]